ncbi:MAG TPA: TIGR04283 family arsenosugar biosynthesis glycosyltransferase [Candidatus Polarisedimenticolia bacterium]|nr:TIGR04283 family arsenosugar biosynthesis glycosyltransferase [Candidatus Polarisedimenticolia bacterium]
MTIVVPVLDEEAILPAFLIGLEGQEDRPVLQVILVDGGSRDRTIDLFESRASGWSARGWTASVVVVPEPGRALQMNAGARLGSGEALLFLHADTHLPRGATAAILKALAEPDVAGGGFRHSFHERGLLLRLISAWATARSLTRRIHYGDQAIFVRRALFERLGGFPEVPLFEDLGLSRALRKLGRIRTLPIAAETSARRLRQGGIGRTALRFAWIKLRRALGADPARLMAGYRNIR